MNEFGGKGGNFDFSTTSWDLVGQAQKADIMERDKAIRELFRRYAYPLYSFLRRTGQSREDAEDIVQMLFAKLVAGNLLANVSPDKGRFRTFLLVAVKNIASTIADAKSRQKRGAGKVVAWDSLSAEERYLSEPKSNEDPARIYARNWALETLHFALDALKYESRMAEEAWDLLKPFLDGQATTSYLSVAQQLGTSEGAVKMQVSRLRERFRNVLRGIVALSVSDPTAIEDELRALKESLTF